MSFYSLSWTQLHLACQSVSECGAFISRSKCIFLVQHKDDNDYDKQEGPTNWNQSVLTAKHFNDLIS